MSGAGAGVALGIDLGTSGVRAVLADAAGQPGASAACRVEAGDRRDPARLWEAVETVLGELAGELDAVRAVAVDGTSGTILPVDEDCEPLGLLSLYNEAAEPAHVARVARAMPRDSAAGGATSPLARALAFPDRSLLLHEADWIAGKLCLMSGFSDENNALKTGHDPRARIPQTRVSSGGTHRTVGDWPGWIEKVGLKARLPQVREPGQIVDMVSRVGTRAGLPANAQVVAGTTDGCASFLATGASEVGDGVTALGSTLTMKLMCDAPIFAPEYGIYSHRLFDRWLAGGASNTGGAVLAAFFDPATMATLSARIDPAQPSGLDYYPLARPGERFPVNDPTLAPRLGPRPPDDALFLHGMLEGIAAIEAEGYRKLHALGGAAVRRVLTVGGGARNAAWTTLRRRALGVPVESVPGREAAFGTALLALRSLR